MFCAIVAGLGMLGLRPKIYSMEEFKTLPPLQQLMYILYGHMVLIGVISAAIQIVISIIFFLIT